MVLLKLYDLSSWLVLVFQLNCNVYFSKKYRETAPVAINPLKPNGRAYLFKLDESISNLWDVA